MDPAFLLQDHSKGVGRPIGRQIFFVDENYFFKEWKSALGLKSVGIKGVLIPKTLSGWSRSIYRCIAAFAHCSD
jgi:hypothetical protein